VLGEQKGDCQSDGGWMEHRVRSPLSEWVVSRLSAGDIVWLSGVIYTARDKAHQRLEEVTFDLRGGVIYHCGPLIKGDRGGFSRTYRQA